MIQGLKLPLFLDDYIFKKLNGKFDPDYAKFNTNLNHQKEDVLTYIGTYFPRSFAEAYSIYDNIIKNETIAATLEAKEEINILDIGSGTGGNLSGLLLNLVEKLPNNVNFNIIAIDGNKEALLILTKIIRQFEIKYNLNIHLSCHYIAFDNIKELHKQSKQFIDINFDFIVSFKMINEIIKKNKNSYYDFYDSFANFLNQNGLLLLLDVTVKIDNLDYIPILLNKQSNIFIQDKQNEFKTLIPTCGNQYDVICNIDCFSNNIFYISHSKTIKDKSKVTYRIIGREEYVSKVLDTIDKGGTIGWMDKSTEKQCHFSDSIEKNKNGYKI